MSPELRTNDILIVDPDVKPRPGCIVVTKLYNKNEIFVRKYKELSISRDSISFELRAENAHWGNINVDDLTDIIMIGIVTCLIRDI